jgi:hypothetical protein
MGQVMQLKSKAISVTVNGVQVSLTDDAFITTTRPPRLIALTGPAGCGKTTIAQALVAHGFVRVRFAGPIKDMLRALGLTEAQVDGDQKEVPCDLLCGHTPRHCMQFLGTEVGRNMVGPDLWANIALRRIDELLVAGHDVVVDDLRFDNEARPLAERHATIVLLQRGKPWPWWRRLWRRFFGHRSERGIDSRWLTATVDNNGSLQDTLSRVLIASTHVSGTITL